ncbi:NAD(P)H-dependent oxidoreductase [Paracoccus sp. TK19116]|uniref:NAD(P)H-dependent oxidoreductase n=1 Tax=Paracoccus albicereus TaxID=2922394 RepID=A0ABT1MNT8_9RHOB|nr:NAD(P)H-dependent oxidoreductase [Paracoccus albicereus]MCQ0969953.1 NAD(P)H-dependent oxidoreductase [Paracoccus albicereus]
MPATIAVLIGSLRKGSLNRKFAQALEGIAADRMRFDYVDLSDLPHYDQDLWDNPPASVTGLKQKVEASDAVLIVTPEYNRFFPGIIKDALDWGSRPKGEGCWAGKPCAITGVTPGATGTAVAQGHTRLAALSVDLVVQHSPELYVQWNDERFGDDGSVKNDQTRKFMGDFITKFAAWIEKHGN